jgi:hypothetical protein
MTDKADFPPGARPFLAAFGRYEHFLHECSRRALIAAIFAPVFGCVPIAND